MKTTCAILLSSVFVAALAVDVGDTLDEVRKEMGAPTVYANLGETAYMTFAQGRVDFRHGRVTTHDIVDATEWAAMQAAAAEALAARVAQAEALVAQVRESQRFAAETPERQLDILAQLQRRNSLVDIADLVAAAESRQADALRAEGEAVATRLRGDARFLATAPDQRVGILRTFQVRFPGVNVNDLMSTALLQQSQMLAEKKQALQAAEMARLRTQVAELERKALEAEREAADAREEARAANRYITGTRYRVGTGNRVIYQPYVGYVQITPPTTPAPCVDAEDTRRFHGLADNGQVLQRKR